MVVSSETRSITRFVSGDIKTVFTTLWRISSDVCCAFWQSRSVRRSPQSGVDFADQSCAGLPRDQSKCRLPKPFHSLGIPTAPSMISVMSLEPLPNVRSQLWQSAMPQMWKSCPARELNPRSSAIAAGALTTELQDWDWQGSLYDSDLDGR